MQASRGVKEMPQRLRQRPRPPERARKPSEKMGGTNSRERLLRSRSLPHRRRPGAVMTASTTTIKATTTSRLSSSSSSSTMTVLFVSSLLALIATGSSPCSGSSRSSNSSSSLSFCFLGVAAQPTPPNNSTISSTSAPSTTATTSSSTTSTCASPMATGRLYSVFKTVDAIALAIALKGCSGGEFNVSWNGLVTLSSPLVVASRTSLTITGVPTTATGELATLDGNNVTGLLDLEAGSKLLLEGVILQNARRATGNGGAISADARDCEVSAKGSTFRYNMAESAEFGEGRGGAIALGQGAVANLENCTLSENYAAASGGGVFALGNSDIVFRSCVLNRNEAGYYGGAVGMLDGRTMVKFVGSYVSGNLAQEIGGGVYGENSTVVVEAGSMFLNNTVYGSGGGISLQGDCTLNITRSTFGNNTVTGPDNHWGTGGAVRVQGNAPYSIAKLYVKDSLFGGNLAPSGAAIWVSSGHKVIVEESYFSDNQVFNSGGGGEISGAGEALFISCNFTRNFAHNGGGALSIEESSASFRDCLFDGNYGSFHAGALYLWSNSTVNIKDSSFVENYVDIETIGSGSGTGAGITVRASTLRVTDSVFKGNEAGYDEDSGNQNSEFSGGGAVWMDDRSNATFQDCMFTRNGGGDGGAVLLSGFSMANMTNASLHSNNAARHGGAMAALGGSSLLVFNSRLENNNANLMGGSVYLDFARGIMDYVSFVGNTVIQGSGGAVAGIAGSNMTIISGNISSNSASESGGHLLASGSNTDLSVVGPLSMSRGLAGLDGGAVHAEKGAGLDMKGVLFVGNRAERNGGAVSALGGDKVCMSTCDVAWNTCGGGGGGVSVESTEFAGISVNFSSNTAELDGGGLRGLRVLSAELQLCLFHHNMAMLGGAISGFQMDLEARDCDVVNNVATTHGGGLRLSYRSSALMIRGNVSYNRATMNGGGISVDSSSEPYDNALRDAQAPSSFRCEGMTQFESNVALESGGAFHARSGAIVQWDSCISSHNEASIVGGAIFASHATVELGPESVLAYDTVPSGAMVFALDSDLKTHGASFLSAGLSDMYAVHMNSGCTMKVFDSTFSGWAGTRVIFTEGELEMDSCDLRGSPADTLVVANGPPARIRNVALGVATYDGWDSRSGKSFGNNFESCEVDPCGTTATFLGGVGYGEVSSDSDASSSTETRNSNDGGGGESCVDGDLGVYCPCFVATVTGEEVCLGQESTVILGVPKIKPVVGTAGTLKSNLNISAGTEGGDVVWRVHNVFSQDGLTWETIPSIGVLEPGGNTSVSIRGQLEGARNGLTVSRFQAVSLGSGQVSFTMVNTTFYYCIEGEYYAEGTCLPCTDIPTSEGLECVEKGVMLDSLPLVKGYWRANINTTTIRECLHEDACAGGGIVSNANDYCNRGFEGPYCAVCSAGYSRGIAHGCRRCSSHFKAVSYTLVAVAGLILLVLAWFLYEYLVQDPAVSGGRLVVNNGKNRIVTALENIPLHKLKIPIVVFQILTQYADITSVEFPEVLERFFSLLDMVNLDLGWALSATCLVNMNFYGRLLFTTLCPLILLGSLGCTYAIARNRVLRAVRLPTENGGITTLGSNAFRGSNMSESRQLSVVNTKHMAVLVGLTFLLYSTVSTIVFQTFECDELEELQSAYLRADYSMYCYTAQHKSYMVYSGVMILVYPLGIPALYGWLLFTHRHRIFPKQALRDGVSPERRLTDKKIAHTRLLWEAYRPQRYWFEVVECARRLLLTGCLVFILPDTAGQATVACVLSVVSMCLFITLRPYVDNRDDRAYILGCLVIFLTMFMSLLRKVKIEKGDSQSEVGLSWLLIVLSICLMAFAVVECFLEVLPLTRDAARTDPSANFLTTTSSTRQVMSGIGEEKLDNSTFKGFSPENGLAMNNPTSADHLYDFVTGIHNGSGGGGNRGGAIGAGEAGSSAENTNGKKSNMNGGGGGATLRVHGSGNSERNSNKHAFVSGSSGASGGGGGGATGGRVSGFAVVDNSCSDAVRPSGKSYDGGDESYYGSRPTNTYGPLTLEENQASLYPGINSDDALDSPGMAAMAEEQFARRVMANGGSGSGGVHRRGGSSRSEGGVSSLVPAMPEGDPADVDTSEPYYPGESTTVLNLRPAGPEANAFPMPSDAADSGAGEVGFDVEPQAVSEGGKGRGRVGEGEHGVLAAGGASTPTTSAYFRQYLLQTESTANLLQPNSENNSVKVLHGDRGGGRKGGNVAVAPGLEKSDRDG